MGQRAGDRSPPFLGVVALVAIGIDAIGNHIGAGGFSIYLSAPPARDFGGNFARQLPLNEGLGIWFGHDFRVPTEPGALSTAAAALAIGVFAGAVIADLRRWRTTLLLPTAAAIVISLAARQTRLPYFSAKLMVSAGPLLVLFVLSGILGLRPGPERGGVARWRSLARSAGPVALDRVRRRGHLVEPWRAQKLARR